MGRGFAWLDTGTHQLLLNIAPHQSLLDINTHESLLDASNFIQTIEKRQGLKVACIEEIAFEMGYILC